MISAMGHGILGLAGLIAMAWIFSENRKAIAWKTVLAALTLQLVLALVLLKLPGSRQIFMVLNGLVFALEKATMEGTSFVFGYLGGASPPFAVDHAGSAYILAFRGLPLILVVSALSALLFYWRILPAIVRAFSWLLKRSLGIGGAEGLAAAANVFVGMVESPLLIRPYLGELRRAELFSLMTCGMATIAGTVMVLYASILKEAVPDALGHLLVASIISAPAAIGIARIMVPNVSGDLTAAGVSAPTPAHSSMEAVTNGTIEGVKLLINVVAMLVVLVALVGLVNQGLSWLPAFLNEPLTLQRMLGWIMAPVAWLVGIPWNECFEAGSLMGTKTILNEFLAYLQMAGLSPEALSSRSRLIMTYAMCGFANFGSLGIMIGGLGAMAPERRSEIVSLGLKSIVAGTLATFMTGAIVGFLSF